MSGRARENPINSQTLYFHFDDKESLHVEVGMNGKITLASDAATLDFCAFLSKEVAERIYQQLGNCLGASDE